MSIVILDAMERESDISRILIETSNKMGKDSVVFKLGDMNILPCRSCGACAFKSPGKCILKDDTHEMLGAVARCTTVIILTPVRFGGYPSQLKKAVDKFMNLGLPLYMVKQGHLLHPPRYGTKALVGIGVYEGNSKDQEESFKRLVENNGLNLHYAHKAIILKPSEEMEKIKYEIGNMLKEVC